MELGRGKSATFPQKRPENFHLEMIALSLSHFHLQVTRLPPLSSVATGGFSWVVQHVEPAEQSWTWEAW